jgi:hypothetical protein
VRANIAKHIAGHRWLICTEVKRGIDNNVIAQSEAVGLDAEGKFFRIKGNLRQGATDLLSLESYENALLTFSDEDGFTYIWNPRNPKNLIQSILTVDEYLTIINKFELYPLFSGEDAYPINFKMLDLNLDYYNQAVILPKPKTFFQLENPAARRSKTGLWLSPDATNRQFSVIDVEPNSAAAEAGITPNDKIIQFSIDGVRSDIKLLNNYSSENKSRHYSFTINRIIDGKINTLKNVTLYIPSPAESFILKITSSKK